MKDNPFKKILETFNLPEESIESLSESIMIDAKKRFPDAEILIDEDESVEENSLLKSFGYNTVSLNPDDKRMVFEVVNDQTIEYESEDGELLKYAFDEVSMRELAADLEGIPVVIGDAHEADLPLAYFTGKATIEEVDGRKALMAEAKLRTDKNAPFDFESLIKNPALDINGGSERIGGSLKFYSKDIPVEFNNGVKVNYMTGASPRHYALLNSPVFETAGLKAKNFGDNQEENLGEQMTEETKTVPEVDVTKEVNEALNARFEELELPALEDETVREAVMKVIVDLATPKEEMIAKADYEALQSQLKEKEDELAQIERDALVDKIRAKELGDEPDEEAVEAFEAKVKEFGMSELRGYDSALDVAAEKIKAVEEAAASRKDFGKGKVSTDTNRKKERKITFGPRAVN